MNGVITVKIKHLILLLLLLVFLFVWSYGSFTYGVLKESFR